MIWFTSDTHFFHKNIVRGVSNWPNKDSCRNFETISEMNEVLVNNINRVVKEDDTLFHLGDWSFHGKGHVYDFRGKIRCRTVHLILGNHDTDIHEHAELQSAFTTVDFYREININGQKIVLCHYPLRTWNRWHHGSWHLYGHCHGKMEHQLSAPLLRELIEAGKWDIIRKLANNENVPEYCPNGRSMDVGVDTHPEFRPYSYTEIHDIMSSKHFTPADSHREKADK